MNVLISGAGIAAVKFAPFVAPPSRLGMLLRSQVMKLMAIPFVAELAVGRELRDVSNCRTTECATRTDEHPWRVEKTQRGP